jgi:hypothetical protein
MSTTPTTPATKFANDREPRRQPRTELLTIRVSVSEKAQLERAAQEANLDVADIFREGLDLWFANEQQHKTRKAK